MWRTSIPNYNSYELPEITHTHNTHIHTQHTHLNYVQWTASISPSSPQPLSVSSSLPTLLLSSAPHLSLLSFSPPPSLLLLLLLLSSCLLFVCWSRTANALGVTQQTQCKNDFNLIWDLYYIHCRLLNAKTTFQFDLGLTTIYASRCKNDFSI